MGRKIYLKTTPLDEAKRKYFEGLNPFFADQKQEIVPVRDALGRVTAAPVYAKMSSPSFHSCAMDGIMVNSEDTKLAREHMPIVLREDQFLPCDTGDPLLPPFDAVIMVEDLSEAEGGVKIKEAVHPWKHVRPVGEDIIEKDLLFPQSHQLKPIDLSVLLAAGLREVNVYKKPSIAIIPTGDEIVSGEEVLKVGEIIESNSAMFKGMATEIGATCEIFPIIPDDFTKLKDAVIEANKKYDVVAMIAGTSAGREDFTIKIAQELGEVYIHGLAIKPGKPAILAKINEKPFIGLPGYPVSGHIVFDEIVRPILLKKGLLPVDDYPTLSAILTRPTVSSLQHQEYIRVKVGKMEGTYTATPMERGAGSSMSLAQSDGYLIIPQHVEGYNRGEEVNVRLHKPFHTHQLDHRLVVIGSHDMVLDVINDLFAETGHASSLISSHVGSMAGLQSLLAKECHVAPSHLLGKDGQYNDEAMAMFFKGQKMMAMTVVGRRQGIILPKGNPLQIRDFKDLTGKTMINRQRGAGTRVLFDYLLEQNNMKATEFVGYDREVTTHLAVALAVKNGDCDFGIGVEAAAIKLDCDFLYLADEAYEFIMYEETFDNPAMRELVTLLQSDLFRKTVDALGGYETSQSGSVRVFQA